MSTGLKNQPVADLILRFFGDLKRWPIESDGRNFTQDQVTRICEHMSSTGECLWHAQTVVMGWKTCHCAKCEGGPPK